MNAATAPIAISITPHQKSLESGRFTRRSRSARVSRASFFKIARVATKVQKRAGGTPALPGHSLRLDATLFDDLLPFIHLAHHERPEVGRLHGLRRGTLVLELLLHLG